MLSTLEEFRSFLRPNKEIDLFSIKDCIESVLILTKDEFLKNLKYKIMLVVFQTIL